MSKSGGASPERWTVAAKTLIAPSRGFERTQEKVSYRVDRHRKIIDFFPEFSIILVAFKKCYFFPMRTATKHH